ncbi:MAG TPA: hypothetical protein ENJ35_05340 [Gammaproteobacteria bacterium]|nr:hypothetical protein [Gammaproteobacteria bacterium]
MTEKKQNKGLVCAKCHNQLTRHDRRPRSLRMRIQHHDSRLYLCPECGTKNLILHPPAHVDDRKGSPAVCRYHEVRQRIARNRRAYVKLREIIESDQRLLKHLSDDASASN